MVNVDAAFFTISKYTSSKWRDTIAFCNTSLVTPPSNSPYSYETGYQTSSMVPSLFTSPITFNFITGGTYRIGFGIIHGNSQLGDSALLLDNVNISYVPVPGAVLLGILGLDSSVNRRLQPFFH